MWNAQYAIQYVIFNLVWSWRGTGLTVGESAKKEARRRDWERLKQAEKRVQDRHKKYRVAWRQAKQRDEDLKIRHKGVTYEAGAFGELEPCNKPKRKKKAK